MREILFRGKRLDNGELMKTKIKELFVLWCVKRHLKAIDKEIKKHNRMREKNIRRAALIHLMVDRFNELFPDYSLTLKGGMKDEQEK